MVGVVHQGHDLGEVGRIDRRLNGDGRPDALEGAERYDTIDDALTRIDAKLDALRDDNAAVREDIADHETRLRSLEKGRWPLPTVATLAGLSGAATGVMALLR